MRFLILALAVLALSACSSTGTLQGAAKPDRSGVFVVGTLAPWGSFEHEAAPAYTSLAVARRLAARRLDRQEITADQAIAVQAAADRARAALDAARARADRGDRAGAIGDLRAAQALVQQADQLAREGRR